MHDGAAGLAIATRDQLREQDFAVGEIRVAAAVAGADSWPDPAGLVDGFELAGAGEIGGNRIALGVDVGGDVVGDLAGVVAKSLT